MRLEGRIASSHVLFGPKGGGTFNEFRGFKVCFQDVGKGGLSLRGVAVTTETATQQLKPPKPSWLPIGTVFYRISKTRARCSARPLKLSKPPKPSWRLPPLNSTPLFRHPDVLDNKIWKIQNRRKGQIRTDVVTSPNRESPNWNPLPSKRRPNHDHDNFWVHLAGPHFIFGVAPDDAPNAPSTQWNTEKPQRFFIWCAIKCRFGLASLSLSLYIYAVKLLSGPSLGFLEVILWSKLGFWKLSSGPSLCF